MFRPNSRSHGPVQAISPVYLVLLNDVSNIESNRPNRPVRFTSSPAPPVSAHPDVTAEMRFGFVYIHFDVDYVRIPQPLWSTLTHPTPDHAIVRPVSFKYLASLTLTNGGLRKEVTLFLVPVLAR